MQTTIDTDTGIATREEMQAILAERIWRAHRMTVDQYFAALASGCIERSAEDDAIAVFAGEYAGESSSAGPDRV